MQKLQLFIQGERLDLFDDETVSMTQSIQNIKDIAKVFTEFTQSFTVPASRSNNIIFEHYENIYIDNGFDARQKIPSEIQLNFIPFKTGLIQLNGVELRKNVPYAYKITFYGNTINLKDVLGDSQLSSLASLNQYTLDYDYTNVKSKIENGHQTIIAPLITHTQRLFYNSASSYNVAGNLFYSPNNSAGGVLWSDLKYAVRLYEIIQAIETDYPALNFSTDFFSTSNSTFYNLYMWLHRKSGTVLPAGQVEQSYVQVPTFAKTTTTNGSFIETINGGVIVDTSLIQFGEFSESKLVVTPQATNVDYNVRVLRDGAVISQTIDQQGATTLDLTPLGSGTYTVQVFSETNPLNFLANSIVWTFKGAPLGQVTVEFTNILKNTTSVNAGSPETEFIITDQIPEMKIIDFLTGLFKQFNLTAFVNAQDVIVVRTLDSYYADRTNNVSGGNYTIDQYLSIDTSSVDAALPFKEINFSFKGTKTFLANQYKELNNLGWGELRFTLNDAVYDAPNEVYSLQVPFEHALFERLSNQGTNPVLLNSTTLQYGFFVDSNQQPYFGEPLIFYGISQTTGLTSWYLKSGLAAGAQMSNYMMPSNSLALTSSASTKNLNFGLEVNEYTATSTFTGTVFEEEYKTYISAVFNNRRRLTKVNAFLPLKILYNLQMNDYITIGQTSYTINTITTDLTNGKSSLELLNNV